jgi:AMP deaminase
LLIYDWLSFFQVTSPGPVTTYSYKRLQVLEERFNLHVMLNSEREQAIQKQVC